MVFILPLALSGLAAAIRTRFVVGSRRLVGATRAKTGRRIRARTRGA